MPLIRHHSIPLTVRLGDDELEITAEVEFTVVPGNPATGPTYWSGGQPEDPAEIDVEDAHVVIGKDRFTAPYWLLQFIRHSEDAYEMLGSASNWGKPVRDDI